MKAATQFLKTLPLVKSDFKISFGKQSKILDYIFFEPILRFLHKICHCARAVPELGDRMRKMRYLMRISSHLMGKMRQTEQNF